MVFRFYTAGSDLFSPISFHVPTLVDMISCLLQLVDDSQPPLLAPQVLRAILSTSCPDILLRTHPDRGPDKSRSAVCTNYPDHIELEVPRFSADARQIVKIQFFAELQSRD